MGTPVRPAAAPVVPPHRGVLRTVVAAIAGIPGQIAGWVSAAVNGVYFSLNINHAKGRSAKFEKQDLFAGIQQPTIHRPYVLVPGFTTPTGSYDKYVSFLTKDGGNGGRTYFVKQGAFYTQNAQGELVPSAAPGADARVFEMVWSDPRQNPELNLPEMQANMAAITQATGCDKLDLEAYSMGGIDTRLFMASGGAGSIHKLLMLGVPNHGTRSGDVELAIDRYHLGLLKKIGHIQPHDDASMQWLKMNGNEHLDWLNARWPTDSAGIPTLCLGTDGVRTQRARGFKRGGGDGIVDTESLPLPGAEVKFIHDPIEHGHLNNDGHLVPTRAAFFDWD